MNRTIVTVYGKDRVGIIAAVCNYLADHNINILDISQTIVSDMFNMMMIVDATNSTEELADIDAGIVKLGEELGMVIKMQQEDIFNAMHRI